jgi:glycosyltransferase involved in cell wall biosynthesis
MTAPAFTVMLPVHRPPAMLPFAITSVLAQERQDFELFVICDGAPPETAACAQEFATRDTRIRVFVHPKGERNGEIYRDQALREARGEYVCQIGDDDLWLPNHLTEMAALLRDVDFGHVLPVVVQPSGQIGIARGGLTEPGQTERMLHTRYNTFGPTVAGYRLAAYRSLAVGWSPAPPELPSDLHMWRKFLARHDIRLGTRIAVTSLKLAAGRRGDWTMEQRRAEIAAWAERLASPAGRDAYVQGALNSLSRAIENLSRENHRLQIRLRRAEHRVGAMRKSFSWRLTRPFRAVAKRLRGR